MKRLIIISSLIMSTSLMALTAKVEKPLGVVEGTSVGRYAKPGAPVDITYKTTHVEVGDISKVGIELTTAVVTGSMDVKIALDESLTAVGVKRTDIHFTLSKKEQSYPLNLQVSAAEEGLYYIRLLVQIEGKGMRSFAVPVRVGSGEIKRESTAIGKSASGENITAMEAVETIER